MSKRRIRLIYWFKAIPHRRYLAALGILFGLSWILLGLAPHDRGIWALENAPALCSSF